MLLLSGELCMVECEWLAVIAGGCNCYGVVDDRVGSWRGMLYELCLFMTDWLRIVDDDI